MKITLTQHQIQQCHHILLSTVGEEQHKWFFLSSEKMNDIGNLRLNITLDELHKVSINYEQIRHLIIQIISNSFDSNIANESSNINRVIELTTEIAILRDVDLNTYFADKDEIEALITSLTKERNVLHEELEKLENDTGNRKGGSLFSKFDVRAALIDSLH